ncbi:MAG TPA: alpha-L-arabinofuranosidase C-terminal domain-containing protein [Terriglobales bacterium]|nr:alpha-L-arabinofuranosidase C-terminal domain-containing protein [Terriglobales bacterium]
MGYSKAAGWIRLRTDRHDSVWQPFVALSLLALLSTTVAAADAPSETAKIVVDAAKVEASINPMLYGQFDEFMYGGVKVGLYAELLRDRSFDESPNAAGLSRYWERDPDDRNDDAIHFLWNDSVFYPPEQHSEIRNHSLQVEVGSDDGQRRGIYQADVPVRAGLAYHGYLWAKTDDFKGHITVALEENATGGETYASKDIPDIGGDWKQYKFTVTPSKTDRLAKVAVLFYGKGRLWVDQLSLMPGDAEDGVRRDVFDEIKALRPAFIRWPGGNVAQDYHWMWGVGPRDQRTTWVNLSWGNELEPSDFGTDEYIQLCRNVGAEPSITVNVEGRGATAEEAAAWVEYANGAANTKYGRMRVANGHPEPLRVKYWEVGNEIWGSWVRGHSDAETYARNYLRYAEAMKTVDPSIQLIAVGDNNLDWDRTVLEIAGSHIDYLAVHHYYGEREMKGDVLNLMAHPLHYGDFYKQLATLVHQTVPGRDIKLAINEWNTSLPLPKQHSMESALYAGRLMNVFERSDNVAMSAVSDIVNGWSGGVIQASRDRIFVTPTYLVNRLYSSHLGGERLATHVESPTFHSAGEGRDVPFLDAVASRTADGKHLFIKAVNADRNRALAATIEIRGASVAPAGTLETVAGAAGAANSFRTPQAVSVSKSQFRAGGTFRVTFPRSSVCVIVLDLK